MKSIVICSSNKFAKEARAFAKKLEKPGVRVLLPHFYRASGGDMERLPEFDRKFLAMGLVRDHFHKIDLADAVFIFNKGGYAGNSTSVEIGYASALNKSLYALAEDKDLSRAILFEGITRTPKELVQKLK